MAVTLDDIQKEDRRQENADDAKFLRSYLYFFELHVPENAFEGRDSGGPASLVFPLVLNPQSITVSEPYALSATPTVNGGLFIEENGVLARTIRIEGHTGFRPRRFHGTGEALTRTFKTDSSTFERRGKNTPEAISGQRHFQFLQDRVFRTYAELKRDPATSLGTRLAFHNIKDDEHWQVAPVNFSMRRDISSRFVYRYSIELLAYARAESRAAIDVSEDKRWIDKVKDTIQDIKNTIDAVTAFLQEAAQYVDELEKLATGVVSLVSKITDVINAAADFVGGVTDAIVAPFQAVADVVRGLDAAIERMVALPGQVRDTIVHAFRQCADAFDNFGLHKGVFASPAQRRLAKLNALSEIQTGSTASTLRAAEDNPPKTLRAYGKLGTKPLPGDRIRAGASRSPGARTPTFTSAYETTVKETDTLPSLAARHLGSAQQWRMIAALNGLQPPYISEALLPGTVRAGAKLLIPSKARPPSAQPNAAILGAPLEASLEDQALGCDFLLSPTGSGNLYDFVLDPASDGTDIKITCGVPNLQQALRTRMITERRTSVLYRRLGHERLVGIGIPGVDNEIIRFRLREAIIDDPRVADVGSIRFNEAASLDTLDVEIDATVRGLAQPVTTRAALAG